MANTKFIVLFFLLAGLSRANAQMERTMYQVFEVDSFKTIGLEIAGIYELHYWAGNAVMVENNIQISHASPEILNFLVKQGRYDVVADTTGATSLVLRTKVVDRKPIKTPSGECTEIATTKIFVPDTFLWADDKKSMWRKE